MWNSHVPIGTRAVPRAMPCQEHFDTYLKFIDIFLIMMIIIVPHTLCQLCVENSPLCMKSAVQIPDVQSEFELKFMLIMLVQWRNCAFLGIFQKEGIVKRMQ